MATALDTAANLTGAAITEAQEKTWFTAMRAALAEMGDPTARYAGPQNLAIACTVAANALTIALKTRAAADADANNPISFPFRNVTSATGDFSVINLTAAHSLVISAGSTMGAISAKPFRLWLVEFNDAGTPRLGAINCLTTVAGAGSGRDVTAIYPLKDDALYSSTAEGGAGAADSAQVIYTGTAVAAKASRVLGYLEWSSGLTTAGTWDAVPTKIQLFGPGVPLPGNVVQTVRNDTGASTSGTTVIPLDNTIPQITEGDQYMTQAITPSSKANVLAVRASANLANSAIVGMTLALFQDAVANALKAVGITIAAANYLVQPIVEHFMLAETVSATTFRTRAGGGGAGTTYFNATAGTQIYGGVCNSYMEVREIMG